MKNKSRKENISVAVSFIVVVCFVGLVIYILMNKTEKVDPLKGINSGEIKIDEQNKQQEEQPAASQNTMDKNVKILSEFIPVSKVSNLEKIDTVVGKGQEVKVGDTVSVHYTGAVASTGVIFQSSKDFGTDPVTFPLANVIKGWTDGIPGMKIGGTRRLVIPAEMAYGANPPPGSGIPANADLVFDVELISIQ